MINKSMLSSNLMRVILQMFLQVLNDLNSVPKYVGKLNLGYNLKTIFRLSAMSVYPTNKGEKALYTSFFLPNYTPVNDMGFKNGTELNISF